MSSEDPAKGRDSANNNASSYVSSSSESSCENENDTTCTSTRSSTTESHKNCHATVNTNGSVSAGMDPTPLESNPTMELDIDAGNNNNKSRPPLTTIAGDNDARLNKDVDVNQQTQQMSEDDPPPTHPREEENQYLQARVLSLEAQIASLNSTLQEMIKQQKQQQQHQFDSLNITTNSLYDVASNISVTTIPEVDEPDSASSGSSSDSESMCRSSRSRSTRRSRPCEEITATETSSAALAPVDLDSSPERAELQPVPDLEYRSFTPNYEEELRKIRKMSFDTSTGENSVGGGGTSTCNINSSNNNSNHVNFNKNNNCSSAVEYQAEEMNKENGMNVSNVSNTKKEVLDHDSANSKIKAKNATNGSLIQAEISAESNGNGVGGNGCGGSSGGRKEDDTQSVQSRASKKASTTTTSLPVSPEKPPRPPLPTSSAGVMSKDPTISSSASVPATTPAAPLSASPKLDKETIKQMEERLNNNAIMGFIRGLNIDSRQQDGSATADVDAAMEEFLRVPYKIENLLFFGLAICVDSFLNVLTVVPLKFVWSCLCLAGTILKPKTGIGLCRFHRRHLYQVLRVFVIFFVYKFALCPISFGMVYHWIRGQAMLKLYVLMAMVEVFDRLMCSFGQDAMDSLYWNVTRRPYHHRLIASTIVVLIYAVVHSLILFVHAATLNVAMNSADSALMSLLIGGNFAEIKSTVFKKYNKQNLFKITTSDICERFKLVLFLALVLLLNCSQGGMNQEMVNAYIFQSFFILFAEIICDWIKHSFITKFNFIKSSVYQDYSLVLAGDITGLGHESMHMDHCHAVVKRLGFAQIPLVCVMMRYLREAVRFADTLTHDGDSNHVLYSFAVVWTNGSWRMISGWMLSSFTCLVGIKFLLGWAITHTARSIILYAPVEAPADNAAPKRRQAV